MEESQLKGQLSYCFFVDFKKAFDTIYEVFGREFMSMMGVKQGCVLLPILICQCLDQLKDFIQEASRRSLGKTSHWTFHSTASDYVEDVVLWPYSQLSRQNHLDTWCEYRGLTVMVVRTVKSVSQQPIVLWRGDDWNDSQFRIPSIHTWMSFGAW